MSPEINFDRSCVKCKMKFWTLDPEVTHCGDKDCNLENLDTKTFSPKTSLTYGAVFQGFRNYFSKNYSFCESSTVLPRSSSNSKVSSTNMNFITAGISTYETLLDSKNPRLEHFANKLLISTPFVFRFNDLENVGTTKRHNTGFFMFSLHCFESLKKRFPKSYQQDFLQIFLGYYLSLGVPLNKIYLNRDFWTDGVNSGQCVEIFINGEQIGNMVFISEKNGVPRDLKLLDVGLGGQRIHKLLTGQNDYTGEIVKDHIRALVVAFKDKLYPCKTGPGFSIRKILQYLYDRNYKTVDDIKPITDPIIEELELELGEPFNTFYEEFRIISEKELTRYYKYIKA